MRTYSKAALLVLLTLPSGLSAQFNGLVPSTTFPSDHAPNIPAKTLVNGSSYEGYHPYSYGKMRTMMVYDAYDLKIGNSKSITHVGHQGDPGQMSTGHKIQLKMFMGKTLKTHATAEATFAANYTSASVNVFGGAAGKILALPDLGNPTKPGADAPFVFVPLDTVYTHDSSQNLAVEWQVLANDNGNAPWLYTLDSGSFIAKTAKIGSGCPSSANVIPTLTSTQAAIGGNYAVYLSGAPAGNPTALALSLKAASAPIRHPGYALGCNLHIDLGPTALLPVFFLGTTSTSGSFSWNFPVPNDRRLNDLQLYSQAVIADFFASGGGVLSDAGMAELGMNPQQAMISATGDPNAASGSVSKFRGLITHFIHN